MTGAFKDRCGGLSSRLRGWTGEVLRAAAPTDVERGLATPAGGVWKPDDSSAYCPRCGDSAEPTTVTATGCPVCVDSHIAWQRITRLGAYAAPLSLWVCDMKFRRQWAWCDWLGRQLGGQMPQPLGENSPVVCAAPMHWRRRWSRGYDQAALLAQAAATACGGTYAPILRRTRQTRAQTLIAPSKREDNVRGAFALRAPLDLKGRDVFLIDDVKTSGATLSACTRLLKRSGALAVHVGVVAVADPKMIRRKDA